MHTSNTEQIDYKALLVDHFKNSMSVEVDQHYADNLLEKAIDSEVQRRQEEKVIRNKSFCGCPMCDHHSEPYQAKLNKPENSKGE